MKRSYEPFDLVQLPRLDAVAAQALGKEVLTIAQTKDLPEPIAESLTELAAAHRALVAFAANRLPATKPDPAASKVADATLDASWRALFEVLGGWTKLPNHPHAAVAASVRMQIFPDGLRFLNIAYKLEWAESNSRLLLIKNRGLDVALEELGAGSILRTVREAHKEYGEILGVTHAKDAEPETTGIRERLDEFAIALRRYVLRVAASVRTKDESTATLAAVLLAPIQEWQGPGRTTPTRTPPEPTPPEPAPPAENGAAAAPGLARPS